MVKSQAVENKNKNEITVLYWSNTSLQEFWMISNVIVNKASN